MSSTQVPPKLPIIADLAALPRIADPVPSPSNEPVLDELTAQFTQALYDIRSRLPEELKNPKVGIVCGSGLQGLADILQDRVEVPYGAITGFGESTGELRVVCICYTCTPSMADTLLNCRTVRGHQSSLSFGFLGSSRVPVVAQLGRFHAYEGFPLQQVVYPMRIMKLLGCKAAVITNAAGGLNPQHKVGTILAILDHISLPSMVSHHQLLHCLYL
jgi:purine-nucleoside phosphorylase